MNLRNLAIWGVIVLALIAVYGVITKGPQGGGSSKAIAYSEMLNRVDSGDVKAVTIKGAEITAQDRDGTLTSTGPQDTSDLEKRLEAKGASITFQPPGAGLILTILLNALPILLLIGVWVFFMRQMQGGARGAMGFGKSKAKLLTENKNKITFDAVAGVDEAKEDLTEIVDFLKD